MNSLPFIRGETLRHFPHYVWQYDLIAFDGPFLCLYKDGKGGDVLFSWLDCDTNINRWCIIPIRREDLIGYLSKRASLLDVYMKSTNVIVFDVEECKKQNFIKTEWKYLPENYLPLQESFLDDLICTESAKQLAENLPSQYLIGLEGDFYLEDLAGIPKLYQQLYSFHYSLEYLTSDAVRSVFSNNIRKWRGGFSVVNMFDGLKMVIPSIHRPKLLALHYNSPGSMALSILPGVAKQIHMSINSINDKFQETERLYQSIAKFLRNEKINGVEHEEGVSDISLSDDQTEKINGYIAEFFEIMGWQNYSVGFFGLEISTMAQLKVLLAYYRRLRGLRSYVVSGKINL